MRESALLKVGKGLPKISAHSLQTAKTRRAELQILQDHFSKVRRFNARLQIS